MYVNKVCTNSWNIFHDEIVGVVVSVFMICYIPQRKKMPHTLSFVTAAPVSIAHEIYAYTVLHSWRGWTGNRLNIEWIPGVEERAML